MLAEFLQMWDELLDCILEQQLSDEQIESGTSDVDLFSDEYEAVHNPIVLTHHITPIMAHKMN